MPSYNSIQDSNNIPAEALPFLRQYGFDGSLIKNKDGSYGNDSETNSDTEVSDLNDAIGLYNKGQAGPALQSSIQSAGGHNLSPQAQSLLNSVIDGSYNSPNMSPMPATPNNILSNWEGGGGAPTHPVAQTPMSSDTTTTANTGTKSLPVTDQDATPDSSDADENDTTPSESKLSPNDNSLLQQLLQKPNIDLSNTGGYEAGTLQNLMNAQQARNNSQLVNNIGAAGALIGAGIAKVNPNPAAIGLYEQNNQQANQILSDYQNIVANEKNDPNSNLSTSLRGYLANQGIHLGDNTSASTVEQVLPNITKMMQMQNQTALRLAMENNRNSEAEKLIGLRAQEAKNLAGVRGDQTRQTKQLGLDANEANQGAKDETAALNTLLKDKNYVQAKGQQAAGNQLINMTDDAMSNPQSAKALAVYAARYSTGGQRLNQAEIHALGGGSPDIMNKLHQIMQTGALGTLTPQNAQFMKQFISVTSKSINDQVAQMQSDSANSFKDIHGHFPSWYHPPQQQSPVQQSAPQAANPQPTPAPVPHPDDAAAIAWAQAPENVNNPLAKQILQANGVQ